MIEDKKLPEGAPFLEDGVCVYCGDEIDQFSCTPLIRSEDGRTFHEMCEDCADKYYPGWNDEEDEDHD